MKAFEVPTWELVVVGLHVCEDIGISIYDDKTVGEDLDDSTDVEILWSIELRFIWRASGFGYTCPLQEFSADPTRVSDRWFMDGDHVV